VIFNLLAGGVLAGKYKSKVPPKDGRYSDATVPMAAMCRDRYFKDSTFEALQVIERAISKHNLTMAETALRWCVHHSKLNVADGGKGGIIIGACSIGQLENNIMDLEKGPLPEMLYNRFWSVFAILVQGSFFTLITYIFTII
jgi:aflatoxin B1 aldehyde reductase